MHHDHMTLSPRVRMLFYSMATKDSFSAGPSTSGSGPSQSTSPKSSTSSSSPLTSGSSSTMEPIGCDCGLSTGSTPTKKKKRNAANWQKTKRKRLRNSGKEYLSAKKKKVNINLISVIHSPQYMY